MLHQHDKFRIEVFLPILDKLSQTLMLLTQAYDVVHKRFGFILLSMGADEIAKVGQNLQQCYPNDLELSFPQEFKHFLFYRTFEFRQGNADMYIHMYMCTAINCTVLFLTIVSNQPFQTLKLLIKCT